MTRGRAEPVRIGIVGLGNWGRLHAETLATLPGAQLAAVCDLDPARRSAVLEAIRAKAGAGMSGAPAMPVAFESFDACLRDADLDALVIATKDEQHAGHAVAALDRGWYVFVEKPLALTLTDARAVLTAAGRTGRAAVVGTITSKWPALGRSSRCTSS